MTGQPRLLTIPAAVVLAATACGGTPSADTPSAPVDYVLLEDDDSNPDQVGGAPGTYALTARGADSPPLAVVDVPAGYANFGFFSVVPAGFPDVDVLWSVQYWTVDGIFIDPCAMDNGTVDAGTSIAHLSGALHSQQRGRSTVPTPAPLDGYKGLYLELRAPSGMSFQDCDRGYFGYWEGSPDDAQHTVDSPGTVDRLWILEVDGHRVVLLTTAPPGTTRAQVEQLREVVESVRFVEPD